MAIIPNLFTPQDTPNFIRYTPATEALGESPVLTDALDMVSLDTTVSSPVSISYFVGAASEYFWTLSIKHIAYGTVITDVPLNVTVSCDTNLFTINNKKSQDTALLPTFGSVAQFVIQLDKTEANNAPLAQALRNKIKISVSSENKSGYVYTNNQVSLLNKKELPTVVTVN
jgi:hypothetical protein